MAIGKLDKRLATEIEEKKSKIKARKITAKKVRIPVIIEHANKIEPLKTKSKKEKIENLKKETAILQKTVVDKLVSLGVKRTDIKQLWITNVLSVELTIEQIEKIAELDDVKIIRLDKLEKVTCINVSVPKINAPQVWNLGYTGSGVKVAVLDTGIDKSHPALLGKVIDEFNTSGDPAGTPGNHGTHVAGIIASIDPIYRGVAYGASLINGKVSMDNGSSNPTSVIDGIQQAVSRGADVINMSLGFSHLNGWQCSDGHCILCEAADRAVELGVVVVTAAGNEDDIGTPDTHIRCPGNARGVITVGATNKITDRMTDFSSSGPTPYKAIKPDVCAPGYGIMSTIMNGGWDYYDGTSMACPHVAGLAALLLQKYPHFVCQDIKHILATTALDTGWGENFQGAGIVDALAEFNYFDPAAGTVDLYVRDNKYDIGNVPVLGSSDNSPDIWVQLIQNGKEDHGIVEPHTSPEYGQVNYAYVRIHNRGSVIADSLDVNLIVAGFPTQPGVWEDLGVITINDISPGQTRVVGPFEWIPPKKNHGYFFKVGLDYPQHALRSDWKDVNVGEDNNIAQRNIDVVDLLPNRKALMVFCVKGIVGEKAIVSLAIERSSLSVEVKLKVLKRYIDEGVKLTGIKVEQTKGSQNKTILSLTGIIGIIEGIRLLPGEMSMMYLAAKLHPRIMEKGPYSITVMQKIDSKKGGKIVSKVTYWIPSK